MWMRIVLLSLISLTGFSSVAQSAFLTTYNFAGAAGNQASQAPDVVASGLSGLNMVRGSGITATSAGNSFSASGWNSSSLDLNDYFSFGFSTNSGFTASLDSLAYSERRSGTGPTSAVIRYSFDNFATFGSVASYTLAANTVTQRQTFNLSGITALQNFTGTVEFRLYAFGASASAGTYRLGISTSENPNNFAANLLLEGSVGTLNVNPVPGPSGLLLGFVGVGFAGLARLRQKLNRKSS